MKLTVTTPDGGEIEIAAKNVVCDRCRGTGTHTNPAIDGNGLTSDDMDEWTSPDWDFREEYLRGTYDVICEECKGERVVLVPDESRCTPEELALWEQHLRDESEYRQEIEMERRMGA